MRRRYYDTSKFIYTIISDCVGCDVYADGIPVGKVPDQCQFVYESDSDHDIVFSIAYNKSTVLQTTTENQEVVDMRASESIPIQREFSISLSDEVYLDEQFVFGTFVDQYQIQTIQTLSSPSSQTCKAGQTVTMNAVSSTREERSLVSTSFKNNSDKDFNLHDERDKYNYTVYRYVDSEAIIDNTSSDYPRGLAITTGPGWHTTMSLWINYWQDQYLRNVKLRIFSANIPGTYITANINVTV